MIDFHACLEPPPPAPLLLCFAVPFNEFAFNQSSAQSERHPWPKPTTAPRLDAFAAILIGLKAAKWESCQREGT